MSIPHKRLARKRRSKAKGHSKTFKFYARYFNRKFRHTTQAELRKIERGERDETALEPHRRHTAGWEAY